MLSESIPDRTYITQNWLLTNEYSHFRKKARSGMGDIGPMGEESVFQYD